MQVQLPSIDRQMNCYWLNGTFNHDNFLPIPPTLEVSQSHSQKFGAKCHCGSFIFLALDRDCTATVTSLKEKQRAACAFLQTNITCYICVCLNTRHDNV